MVCVGHYNPNKQQDFVIDALAQVQEKYPELVKNIFFTMVGPGEKDYCNQLKKMIAKYGLEKQVSMESFRDDIDQYLGQFNLYINSSKTENLPLSVLEAMSSGLPVLGTINDGTTQLIFPGENGFLCKTPEEMAEKMVWLLQHPAQLKRMSLRSREIVESHFSVQQYVQSFERTFDEILSQTNDLAKQQTFINGLYESIVGESINKFPLRKILVIYPKAAMPTYVLGVQIPFDVLKEYGVLKYDSIEPHQFKVDMLDDYDAVLCVRFYDDFAYSLLKTVKKLNKPFFWMIDDNYSGLQVENGHVVHEEKANPEYERMYRESSAVFVYSGGLYHFGLQFTDKIVRLSSIQPDNRSLCRKMQTAHENIIIGFMGTLMRDHDFDVVTPAIQRIIQKYGNKVEFEFIGYCPDELKDYPQVFHFEFITDYQKFRKFFASRNWDIALAPLKQTLFNASKTNNKYREYSSFHIAGIYSDIPTYYCVKDGRNGILSQNTENDWFKSMVRLIDNSDLRNQIADNALDDVLKTFNPINGAKEMMRAICRYSNLPTNYQITAFSQSNYSRAQNISYHIPRAYDPNKICFSGNINKSRKYKVYCDKIQVSFIGLLFGAENPVSGSIRIRIYSGKYLLRTVERGIKELNFSGWNYFRFPTIQGTGCKELTICIEPLYSNGKLGVFEDPDRRTFWYKVFNKLHFPLPGKNTLMVDFISQGD